MKIDVKLLNANCSWEQVTFKIPKPFQHFAVYNKWKRVKKMTT